MYFEDSENINDPDTFADEKTLGNPYPSAEESMIRLALEKTLTAKQKKIWEYWNFDKLSQIEIGKKLRPMISQQAVEQQIKTIEKQVEKWIKGHLVLYTILKNAEDTRKAAE